MKAARMLHEAIEKYLGESNISVTRVVVRIYADLTELSKQLAKSKLTGLEKRSLAPFAAGFTRAINHFDFVDALDEEGTKFKIRGMSLRILQFITCFKGMVPQNHSKLLQRIARAATSYMVHAMMQGI